MKVKPGACSVCGKGFAGDIESRGRAERPSAGDFGVCLTCGSVVIFVESRGQLVRQLANEEQLAEAPEDVIAEFGKVQRFIMRRHGVGSA